MSIELLIQSHPEDEPRSRRFEEEIITIGRDPSSGLRFEMVEDLEVSTRHAEIRQHEGEYVIVDKASTNGTWVNGARVRESQALNLGDVINLGRSGPELRVAAIDDHEWRETRANKVRLPPLLPPSSRRAHREKEWLVGVVETRTKTLQLAIAGLVTFVVALSAGGWLYVRRLTEDPQVWREVTAPAIRKANDDAVVLVETRIPGTSCENGCEGTGFSIAPDGLIVTNRHVVVQNNVRAKDIRVKFANTRLWLAAHLAQLPADGTVDVALIRLDEPGRYPAVVGVSANGPDLLVGSEVMTIGFPLGTILRMDGVDGDALARTTMTTGSIGKMLSDVFQTDALADHGSSGSPVFDRHGHAIGVVFGGPREESRIVYSVPSNRILELASSTPPATPRR